MPFGTVALHRRVVHAAVVITPAVLSAFNAHVRARHPGCVTAAALTRDDADAKRK